MTDRLSLPFRVDGQGQFVTVDQGGPQALAESVGLLLDTQPGERRSVPQYGTPSQLFRQDGIDQSVLRGVIEQWEPDASDAQIRAVMTSPAVQAVTVDVGVSDEEFA